MTGAEFFAPDGTTTRARSMTEYHLARMGDLDPLLPVQVERQLGCSGRHCGEVALIAAVLEQAIDDYRMPERVVGEVARDMRRAALAYLHSDDTRWPYSARNVCDVLGVDLDALRATLVPGVDAVAPVVVPIATTEPGLLAAGDWGGLLRAVRCRLGLTQADVAALHASTNRFGQGLVSDWEHARRPVPLAVQAWLREVAHDG